MKPTDKQIMNALEYLDNSNEIVKNTNGEKSIPNAFNGYIASFGGSIVQAGLLPTVLIYCNDNDRAKLAKALFHLYKKEKDNDDIKGFEDTQLLSYLRDKWNDWGVDERKRVRNQLVKIATALKLAIRSYELEK